tara:strand:+ start:46768 stop:47346 length:579 start_codon:yes stop_codon:yes gene_type:complete
VIILNLLKTASLALLGLVATANAMPNRTELEEFDNWKVTYLEPENEYWAYTELNNGFNVALVASNDVVGPGCRVTNVAVFSDVRKLASDDITARLMFGESGEHFIEGMLIQTARPWASLYSVVNTQTKYIDDFIESVYLSSDTAITLALHKENEFVAKDVANMTGLNSAYIRMIERCQLGKSRRFRPTVGFK